MSGTNNSILTFEGKVPSALVQSPPVSVALILHPRTSLHTTCMVEPQGNSCWRGSQEVSSLTSWSEQDQQFLQTTQPLLSICRGSVLAPAGVRSLPHLQDQAQDTWCCAELDRHKYLRPESSVAHCLLWKLCIQTTFKVHAYSAYEEGRCLRTWPCGCTLWKGSPPLCVRKTLEETSGTCVFPSPVTFQLDSVTSKK